jgi:hypothetical protein
MTLHPRVPADLMLAPVAVAIDRNLESIRDKPAKAIEFELQLAFDRPGRVDSPEERASRVLEMAVRQVDLHGWTAELTEDRARIRLSGGSVSLDVGLSASLLAFIASGSTR